MNRWFISDPRATSEDTSLKRLVVIILTLVFAFILAALLFNLVTYPINRIVLILADVLVFAALIMALRGILLPGRIITPSVLFIALLLINVFGNGNGIYDSAMIGFAAIVILAGLLLGQRGVLVFGVLVSTAIFLLGILDNIGIFNPQRPTGVSPSDIGTIFIVTVANSIIVYLLIQRLTEIAQSARRNEEQQLEANRELKELQVSLEERVLERTRDLERRSLELAIVSEVARDIASIRDLDSLLNVSVDLIRDRLNYYHTGIFLLDARGEYAILRAASSVAAKAMLEQSHRLKIGAEGIVGYVAGTGLPRIAIDVGADAVHFRNPLLPETHSEIGIPLRSQGLTIGVLDIQTTEASAFDRKDIDTLQLLADQLVVAIENAQLVQRVETTLNELNAANQSQTRGAWRKTIQERSETSLEYDGLQLRAVTHPLPASILKQLGNGKALVLDDKVIDRTDYGNRAPNTLAVPLMSQNQLIGVIGLEQENPNHIWSAGEIAVVEAAAERATIALENARLLQDAQKRAAKERTISEISTRIGNLVDLDNILQTTIQELSRSMPDAEVAIQFHGKQSS
jgi:GAF domain-containing protein